MTQSSSPTATFLFVLGAAVIAGCSGTTQQLGGGDAGKSGSTGLALGEACSCVAGDGQDCCVDGLICDNCSGSASYGLTCGSNDWKCRKPREAGTLCDYASQCEPGAKCVDSFPNDGDSRPQCTAGSTSGGSLAPGRCRESLDCGSNEVCVDSHCKLATGAPCKSSSECASNVCYGPQEGCR